MFAQFNQTLQGVRRGEGSYVMGKWVPGPEAPIVIRTSVQPVTNKDQESLVKRLPEGTRIASAFRLYTKDEIRELDILVIRGFRHEVMVLDVWDNGVLPHYKAIAVRMQTEGVL